MSNVIFSAEVPTHDLVHSLMQLSYEEILEFLAELDDTVGDWDFTRLARDYFVAEMRKVESDDLADTSAGSS